MDYKFISMEPAEEDLFSGKSHSHIAESISEVINNKSNYMIRRQIIGLEGSWGSGKSSVIKMLEKKVDKKTEDKKTEDKKTEDKKTEDKKTEDKKTLLFYYDSWGHQEDLTNRNFLDGLFNFLNENGVKLKKDSETWQEKSDKLFAKKITTKTKRKARLNIMSLVYFIIIIVLPIIVNSIPFVKNFLENNLSFVNTKSAKENIDKLTMIIAVFVIFAVHFSCIFIKFISEPNNENENEKKQFSEFLIESIALFNGDKTEESIEDIIIEGETRGSDFRKSLKELNEILKNSDNNNKLVIVIDNLDRLPNEKIVKIWSTIHSFFAEVQNNSKLLSGDDETNKESQNNIWLVIPYDKERIELAFLPSNCSEKKICEEENSFISKTIEVNFRISEPILSDWKRYFDDKLSEGIVGISLSDMSDLKNIFDRVESIKTPRKIVSFINNIIALKISTQEANIKLKYFALFNVIKSELREALNILTVLESKKIKIEKIRGLFKYDKEYQKNISSIYFNIPLEKADEVLLYDEIKTSILQGASLTKLYVAQAFDVILESVCTELLEMDIENWDLVLTSLGTIEKTTESKFDNLWEKICNIAIKGNYSEDLLDKYIDLSKIIPKMTEEIKKFGIKNSQKIIKEKIDTSQYDSEDMEKYLENVDRYLEIGEKTNVTNRFETNEIVSFEAIMDMISLRKKEWIIYGLNINNMTIITDLVNYIKVGVANCKISILDMQCIEILAYSLEMRVKDAVGRWLAQNLRVYESHRGGANNSQNEPAKSFNHVFFIPLMRYLEFNLFNINVDIIAFCIDFYEKARKKHPNIAPEIYLIILLKDKSGIYTNKLDSYNYSSNMSKEELENMAKILTYYISYEELLRKIMINSSETALFCELARIIIEKSLYNKVRTNDEIYCEQYSVLKTFFLNNELYGKEMLLLYLHDLKRFKKDFLDEINSNKYSQEFISNISNDKNNLKLEMTYEDWEEN